MTPDEIKVLEAAIELCGGYDKVRKYIDEKNADISIIWNVEDVMTRANERHIPITYDQAYTILTNMKRRHDATLGINWDVIDCHIDNNIE
jgi:hypothetical protein